MTAKFKRRGDVGRIVSFLAHISESRLSFEGNSHSAVIPDALRLSATDGVLTACLEGHRYSFIH